MSKPSLPLTLPPPSLHSPPRKWTSTLWASSRSDDGAPDDGCCCWDGLLPLLLRPRPLPLPLLLLRLALYRRAMGTAVLTASAAPTRSLCVMQEEERGEMGGVAVGGVACRVVSCVWMRRGKSRQSLGWAVVVDNDRLHFIDRSIDRLAD